MRPITITMNLSNQSATVVAAAQQTSPLTLAAGAANIDSGNARYLLLTTTEDDHLVNAVIVGLDADGNSITETTALPNNTTKVSTNAYASVSSITLSGAITANMSVGTSNATSSGISPTKPLDFYSRTGAQVAVEVTGTVNFTVRETFDPILSSGTAGAVWFTPSALSSKTSNTTAPLDVGATGVDILINSYTNGATVKAQIITVHSTVG